MIFYQARKSSLYFQIFSKYKSRTNKKSLAIVIDASTMFSLDPIISNLQYYTSHNYILYIYIYRLISLDE